MKWLALVLLAFACGDPIVDTSYRGEPLYFVEGTINAPSELEGTLGEDVRASLFWMPNLSTDNDLVLVEQGSVTAAVRFPATFEIRVYELPANGYYVALDKRYAAAFLVIYVDGDLDGFYSGDSDEIVGVTQNRVLLFARDAMPADDSPTGEAVPSGFSLATPPLNCRATEAPREDPEMFTERMPCFYDPTFLCPEGQTCGARGYCESDAPLTITVLHDAPVLQNLVCPTPPI